MEQSLKDEYPQIAHIDDEWEWLEALAVEMEKEKAAAEKKEGAWAWIMSLLQKLRN